MLFRLSVAHQPQGVVANDARAAPFADFPNPVEYAANRRSPLRSSRYSIPTMSPISRQTDNFLNQ